MLRDPVHRPEALSIPHHRTRVLSADPQRRLSPNCSGGLHRYPASGPWLTERLLVSNRAG
jgi:hypothetical protein